MAHLELSSLAPGLLLGADVKIGSGVELGAYVVIHDQVVVGDGCVVQDHAVLGKRALRRPSDPRPAEPGPLVLEPESSVGCGAVLFAGSRIARATAVGDHAFIREDVTVGAETLLGRLVGIGRGARIGSRVQLQYDVGIVAGSIVEDDVFVGPSVRTMDDNTAGRRPASKPRAPCFFRRGCRIGGCVLVFPGIEIGEEAFVAAGSLVTRDVPPRTLVMGRPAKIVRELSRDELDSFAETRAPASNP